MNAPAVLFETMGGFGGALRLWDRHEARLCASARAFGDEVLAIGDEWRHEAEALLRSGCDVVRLERRLPRDGAQGTFRLTGRSRSDSPWGRSRRGDPVRVLPVAVPDQPEDAPPWAKGGARRRYDLALAQARAGGADDGLLLGADGALLESAIGNLWLLLDSVWTTPPLDGRVLPGIARALLLERAASVGIPVAERPLSLSDLHRADALVLSNAVHGAVPAALPSSTVAEVDSSLRRLWRFAVGD